MSLYNIQVYVRKVDKTTYKVEDGEVNRIKQLLKASEKGTDPYKLDRCKLQLHCQFHPRLT